MDDDFKVGSRVESVNDNGDRETGVIISVFSKVENGDVEHYARVKWDATGDDDTEECPLDELEPEGTVDELEVEFQSVVEAHMQEIDEQLDIARAAIGKAEE